MVFVNLTHKGLVFRINLSPHEIENINNDPLYTEQIGEKYSLYENGNVTATISVEENQEEIHDSIAFETSEQEDDTQIQPQECSNERYIWPRNAVLVLLTELEIRKKQLLQPHKKRVLFGEIAGIIKSKGYPVSWETCERKWRGLQSTYKKISNKENISGSGAVSWEYYDQVQNITSKDPAYNPLTTTAAGARSYTRTTTDALNAVNKRLAGGGNQNMEHRAGPSKRKKDETHAWMEETLDKINKNTCNLHETLNNLIDVQKERNLIFDKMATAL